MRRRITLVPDSAVAEGARLATYSDQYRGNSTHRLECGQCGYEVATGVDPYLYPAMFQYATHIECSQCSSLNVLPADL
jgi:hypothetical protein